MYSLKKQRNKEGEGRRRRRREEEGGVGERKGGGGGGEQNCEQEGNSVNSACAM